MDRNTCIKGEVFRTNSAVKILPFHVLFKTALL